MAVFGTRPEVIKLAPVIRGLEAQQGILTITVASSQQADLLPTFLRSFSIPIDYDLDIMMPGQPLNLLLARTISALDPILETVNPDMVLVQGDTSTALAGALAARMRGIAVAHVEAGLRSGDPEHPFPEEINRRQITHLATLHFAPTKGNVETLVHEGVPPRDIVLSGNPVIDSLNEVRSTGNPSHALEPMLSELDGYRTMLLTHHRRESFGLGMRENLQVIRSFVERHEDTALVFPLHPNPSVRRAAEEVVSGVPRVWLLEPLDYPDFLHLFARAWLVLSDSGGLQEEAPSLGKPLLILRRATERPEVMDCGIARLVNGGPAQLADELERAIEDGSWVQSVGPVDNPFGDGNSGPRIAEAIARRVSQARYPQKQPAG